MHMHTHPPSDEHPCHDKAHVGVCVRLREVCQVAGVLEIVVVAVDSDCVGAPIVSICQHLAHPSDYALAQHGFGCQN